MAKKSRKQYSIPFKVKVVKEYLAQPRGKGIDVLKKYDINTSVICNWVNAYKEGRLEYENTIATAKAKPKVMLINGEKYVEYIPPTIDIININGTDYIKVVEVL